MKGGPGRAKEFGEARTDIARFLRPPVLLIFAMLLGLMIYSLSALRGLETVLDQLRKENIVWTANQTEIELMRFLSMLDRYEMADPALEPNALQDRFDILWSRIAMAGQGEVGHRLSPDESTAAIFAEILDLMTTHETRILAMKPGDADLARFYKAIFAQCISKLRTVAVETQLGTSLSWPAGCW
jgi:hypothetical protein